MRRVFLLVVIFGIPIAVFGQSAASDQQTLQAILTEVRMLRQDLRVSLARVQSIQILLVRLQLQQGTVTKASEHLDDARSKLSDIRNRQKELTTEVKHLEDALGADENLQQQKDLKGAIDHVKSQLEITGDEEQRRQESEIQARQQLRSEEDKLSAIETQLEELMRTMGSPFERSGHGRPSPATEAR